MILIYAISGLAMNHRDTFNVYYDVEHVCAELPSDFPKRYNDVKKADIDRLMDLTGAEGTYSKHFNSQGALKVLIKGGSNIVADLTAGKAAYEKVEERVVIGNMAKLHYNPGAWWTIFSDIFAVALILITLTGFIVLKGKNGFIGRGALLFAIGLLIPLIFLFK